VFDEGWSKRKSKSVSVRSNASDVSKRRWKDHQEKKQRQKRGLRQRAQSWAVQLNE